MEKVRNGILRFLWVEVLSGTGFSGEVTCSPSEMLRHTPALWRQILPGFFLECLNYGCHRQQLLVLPCELGYAEMKSSVHGALGGKQACTQRRPEANHSLWHRLAVFHNAPRRFRKAEQCYYVSVTLCPHCSHEVFSIFVFSRDSAMPSKPKPLSGTRS